MEVFNIIMAFPFGPRCPLYLLRQGSGGKQRFGRPQKDAAPIANAGFRADWSFRFLKEKAQNGIKQKTPSDLDRVFQKKGDDILSHMTAVPSAQAGLTSLFGMGRGEPRRNNHLKAIRCEQLFN